MRDVLNFPGMCITVLKVIRCYLIPAEDKMGKHVRVATGMEANWEIPAPLVFDANMYSWLVVILSVMWLVNMQKQSCHLHRQTIQKGCFSIFFPSSLKQRKPPRNTVEACSDRSHNKRG